MWQVEALPHVKYGKILGSAQFNDKKASLPVYVLLSIRWRYCSFDSWKKMLQLKSLKSKDIKTAFLKQIC
jgi:hypothetical protein